jgi:hypothetical protein
VNRKVFLLTALLLIPLDSFISAEEEDFGFGFAGSDTEETGAAGGGGGPGGAAVKLGGAVSAEIQVFPGDIAEGEGETADRIKALELGNIFSGDLQFGAAGSNADGFIKIKLTPNFQDPAKILFLDEAYVRGFFGNFSIEGGLRKLTWGKADSFGPLDVVNPLDYSDLSDMTDFLDIKIARPLIHASYNTGLFSKVEAVFVPWFAGTKFASSGRWVPREMTDKVGRVKDSTIALAPSELPELKDAIEKTNLDLTGPDTLGLEYAQGGLRFTTTLGPVDFGVQYYSGILNRPAFVLRKNWDTAYKAALEDAGRAKAGFAAFGEDPQTAVTVAQGAVNQAQGGLNASQAALNQAQGVVVEKGAQLTANPALAANPVFMAELNAAQNALNAAASAYQGALTNYGSAATSYGTVLSSVQQYQTAMGSVTNSLSEDNLYEMAYNRYHQIGIDYAQVILGFNMRAELAVNITNDLAGDDGLVYNPALLWSLGFDRNIPVVGINANVQVNESIRLFHNKIGDDPLFDIEAGKKLTSTRATVKLSKLFFRDELELSVAAIWGIEDGDCYIIPAVAWTRGDMALKVLGGIFLGNEEGELGQYRDNYFVKTVLSYSF